MSDVVTAPDGTDANENSDADTVTAETGENPADGRPDGNTNVPTGDTFSREYVEGLRKESAGYRDRVKAAEQQVTELQKRLHHAMVADRGLLANPEELPFDPEHLDPETMDQAIADLLEAKPYLRARPVAGDAGQGARGSTTTPGDFSSLFQGSR